MNISLPLFPLSMGLSCGDYDDFDKVESEVSLTGSCSSCEMDIQVQFRNHNNNAVENDVEFWPVEHPMEPRDEDRPVKCPIPTSSLINDGERSVESSKKRAVNKESIAMVEAIEPPPQAVRKRQHTLTNGDHVIMPLARRLPSFPTTQNVTIFQVLQPLDEFES